MAITVQVPSSFPCPNDDIFSIPTREDLTNMTNKILEIPKDLKLEMAKLGDEISQEIKDEIESIIKDIEDFVETISEILSPYWKKGKIRDWRKEAQDAFTEFLQEFHIYIPTKIAELITKVIPISLKATFLGIEIDITRLFDPAYQKELQAEIEKDIDKFFALVPANLRGYDGEFGVKCDEWKAKYTWQYIKTEIQSYLTNGLQKVFGKLIDMFDEIWKALGLPSLPGLFTMDVGQMIDDLIAKFKEERDRIIKDLKNPDLDNDAKTKLREELGKINGKIMEKLESFSIFGFGILDIIGGKIESSVKSLEQDIADIKMAFKDFKENWQKKLLFDWVKIVKKFFSAIGLGGIFDWVFFTLCDFLKLIGFPPSLPTIGAIAGVMTVANVDPKKNTYVADKGDDSGVTYAKADGIEDEQEVIGTGSLKVFVNGAEVTTGITTSDVLDSETPPNVIGKKTVFDTPPVLGADVSLILVES